MNVPILYESRMNNPYLFHALSAGPTIVRRIIAQIPSEKYDSHTDPERFTMREAIAHIADWEAIDLQRIKQAVENPGSDIQPYDEVQVAKEHNYTASDLGEQLSLYEHRRRETIAYLKSLTPEQWASKATHLEKGDLTVYDQANLVVGHDAYHIEHLSGFL